MQLTLYLDNETEVLAKSAAAERGISLSKWVSQAIQEKTLTQWPEAVKNAAGTFPDWPLEERNDVADVPREVLD